MDIIPTFITLKVTFAMIDSESLTVVIIIAPLLTVPMVWCPIWSNWMKVIVKQTFTVLKHLVLMLNCIRYLKLVNSQFYKRLKQWAVEKY